MLDDGVEPHDGTLRCPTCAASQPYGDVCRRCKSDLTLLHKTLRAADNLYRRALLDLASGEYRAACKAAKECHALRGDPASQRLLAVCAFLVRDWHTALRAAGASIAPDDA
jgi:hypothetical protein